MYFPENFTKRYCPLADDGGAFLAALERPLPKSFRVNSLKADSGEVAERFAGYGIQVRGMEWYPDAFVSDSPDIGATLEHFLGAIYMQELVSMLPPLLIREELEGARLVLDGCAAPGSKTTQLAALMGNKGTIIANDVSYARTKALKFNLEKNGVLNAVITNRDLRFFPDMQFDAALLDAPCSAEGTIRKNAELPSGWSEREIAKHSKMQKKLITKAYDLLRPGGAMVYSTCTFAPEENECVLGSFLQERPDASLESFSFPGFRTAPALESWEGVAFDSRIKNAARVWPHHNDTGGFFLAKVRK
ncbi:MAG: RsmB/NOP family class I SAM-dependent RNA methyltransferase [Candidatus Micrarchaeota archaeon]